MKLTNKQPSFQNIYKQLGSPRPFDVSLRDGLQGLNKTQQKAFTLETKKFFFHKIVEDYNPIAIEVGSITSNKVLPIFKDSKELFQYTNTIPEKECFLLIPNNIFHEYHYF